MFDLTLTFDNGPEPEATPQVLDVLARRGLRTTFFVIGEKLATSAGRRLAARAHADGHWIGNHSYTHSQPFGLRTEADAAEREIGRTQDLIGALAHPKRLFRPFAGGSLDRRLLSGAVVDYLVREKFTCVLWNAIPRDWSDPDGWVERALGQCRERPWTLMVLHDLPTGAMGHLDAFLDRVAALGGRLRQDFPPDCLPIVEGIIVRPIEGYVTPAPGT
jgi:peptidoglycan/xylan/chitin deacetylase (PgdA/CDA1 family)